MLCSISTIVCDSRLAAFFRVYGARTSFSLSTNTLLFFAAEPIAGFGSLQNSLSSSVSLFFFSFFSSVFLLLLQSVLFGGALWSFTPIGNPGALLCSATYSSIDCVPLSRKPIGITFCGKQPSILDLMLVMFSLMTSFFFLLPTAI